MTADQIYELLRSYKYNVGRCGVLELKIRTLEKRLREVKDDVITAMIAPKPQEITDMPRGSQVSNPTEKFGLMLAGDWKSKETAEVEAELAALRVEHAERSIAVACVESWFRGLSDREKWILDRQILNGESWHELTEHYKHDFGEYVSKDTLKRVRTKAIEKIMAMTE